jgi:hypothetical protein
MSDLIGMEAIDAEIVSAIFCTLAGWRAVASQGSRRVET